MPARTPRAFLFALEPIGIKLGLEPIHALLDALGRPDTHYPAVVVAGTNGKGSVTAMIERGLRAAGYRTGRYTSPHLVHLEERFAIDGVDATTADVDEAIARVERAAAALPGPPTFFEATTAVALDLFRAARVDVAVLEVGLGGRLDATNAVTPIATAITAVDFDHEQWLGHTIEAIAAEKAGVVKQGALCVIGRNPPAVEAVVAARCEAVGATLVRTGDVAARSEVTMTDGRARATIRTPVRRYDVALGLRGRHQVDNAVTAIRLLEVLDAEALLQVPPRAVEVAVTDVVWPGRLELRRVAGGELLIDGAHNAQGARALAGHLSETYGRRLPMVIGVMRDKDVDAVVGALAGMASQVVCTAARSDRAMPPADLAAIARRHLPAGMVAVHPTACDAVRAALGFGSPVVVAGSLYLAGEVRAEVS